MRRDNNQNGTGRPGKSSSGGLRRTLVTGFTAALVWLAVAPVSVQALGLGEARVQSYLNQPLEVEIQLIDVSREELEALTVRPADAADYRRVGLELNALQTDLEVTLLRDRDPAVVRVTSSEPVGDPVVQILLHARWSSGRVLREYTLFLDPPRVDVSPPAEPSADDAREVTGRRTGTETESEPEPEVEADAEVEEATAEA